MKIWKFTRGLEIVLKVHEEVLNDIIRGTFFSWCQIIDLKNFVIQWLHLVFKKKKNLYKGIQNWNPFNIRKFSKWNFLSIIRGELWEIKKNMFSPATCSCACQNLVFIYGKFFLICKFFSQHCKTLDDLQLHLLYNQQCIVEDLKISGVFYGLLPRCLPCTLFFIMMI